MSKLVGVNGKPLKSEKMDGSKEVVEFAIGFEDIEKFKSTGLLTVQGPKGAMPIDPQQIITSIAYNICNLMNQTGQKKLIISVTDNSLALDVDKELKIQLFELNTGKHKKDDEVK